MITFKTGLSKKEIPQIQSILVDLIDKHGDFYITKNNLRLMIKDNFDILCDCLKKGDKIAFDENGIVIVTGYCDNSPRKYLKILTKDLKDIDPLLQVMFWNLKEKEVYIKLKNTNPLKDFLLSKCSGYMFEGKNYFCNGVSVDTKQFNKNFDKYKAKLVFSGFEFVGGRGKETLLRYVAVERREPTHQNFKDKDE